MNATALRYSQKIYHGAVRMILFGISGIIVGAIIYFTLIASSSTCDRCDERYYGKCADDVDGVKICERCCDRFQWQARQYLGREYLRHNRIDNKYTSTYRAMVTGNHRYFYDEQSRGRR